MTTSILRRASAEFIGAYALVTAGCGAIIVDATTKGALTHVGVALAFGLVIMVMIAAMGHLSGGHFNPAVTIAFACTPHFAWKDVPFYVGAQLLGAIVGSLTLLAFFGGNTTHLAVTLPSGDVFQSLGMEALLTAFLMFVIISVATDARSAGQIAAIVIGATITLDALWGGPISGASMNPARSLGPALIAGVWSDQWIYVVGPIVGAVVAAGIYEWLRIPHAEPSSAAPVSEDQEKISSVSAKG